MTSVKPREALTISTVRRKPAVTYKSPSPSTAALQSEESQALFASQSAVPLKSTSPPRTVSRMTTVSLRGSMMIHKSERQLMTSPLLPLYHPFGTLALSLPDLDPTAFGLPAPVAVFDDPTRRSSNRQRRPAAKVRDGDEGGTPTHLALFMEVMPTLESEVREKASSRRRRGGGPGGRRRRREAEDGDATYPAKRARNSRSGGVASGLGGGHGVSREEGSPAVSKAASPVLDGVAEEKKPERRSTRSRGAIVRRDSTTSEDTATSASGSARSATNGAIARVASRSGETNRAGAAVAAKEEGKLDR